MYQPYITSKVQRTGTGPYCGSSQTYSETNIPRPHDLLPPRKGWSNDYFTGRGGAVTYYLPGRGGAVTYYLPGMGGAVLVIDREFDRVSDSLSLLVLKMFF